MNLFVGPLTFFRYTNSLINLSNTNLLLTYYFSKAWILSAVKVCFVYVSPIKIICIGYKF